MLQQSYDRHGGVLLTQLCLKHGTGQRMSGKNWQELDASSKFKEELEASDNVAENNEKPDEEEVDAKI